MARKWISSEKLFPDAPVYVWPGEGADRSGVAAVAGPVSDDGTLPVTFEGSGRVFWVPLRLVSEVPS